MINRHLSSKSKLRASLSLIILNHYLRQAIQDASIDYSVLHVILRWVMQIRDVTAGFWIDVETRLRAFNECLASTSGLALMDLWKSLALARS